MLLFLYALELPTLRKSKQADNTRFAETGNMADINQRGRSKIGKTGHGNSCHRNSRRHNPKNVDAAARLRFTARPPLPHALRKATVCPLRRAPAPTHNARFPS